MPSDKPRPNYRPPVRSGRPRDSKLVMRNAPLRDELHPKPLHRVRRPSTGQDEVSSHTATTVMMNLPGWKDDLPVTLCLVDLDDGPRMYAHLTHCKPEEVKIGMRVQAYFESISDEAGVPVFRPA